MKHEPTPKAVATKAIDNIIAAMLKLQNDEQGNYAPMSADTHLSMAVVLLNQFAEINSYEDPEMLAQLNYCRRIVFGDKVEEFK